MSIALTNSAVLSINGAVVETDPNAALYYMEVNFPASVRLFFGYGSSTTTVFTPGAQIPKVIVNLNLHTGNWNSNTGLSGTVGGAGFTAAQADFLQLANLAESFATSNSVVIGANVPWTTAVF